jgi:hypothetical protein
MRSKTFVTTLMLAVLTTIAIAQQVTYDFDRAADFSTFKRYAWVRGTVLSDQLNHDRVVSAINAQLASRGLVQVQPADSPDVLVAYHASFDHNLQITGFSSGWGGYRFPASRTGSARAEEIVVGSLVVDVVNARTKTIVWRGSATRDIDVNASPEKRDKNINKAAEKLFKNFPPKK